MAKIIIKRTSEYNNRLRDYQLFLDGNKVGTIANGQTASFETNPGQHTVVAKIDWCSSPELTLTLKETDQKQLTVGGFKQGSWIMPVAGGLIGIHFILKMAFIEYGIFLVIPAFILLIYNLTVGRKKYLTLTES